MASKIKVRVKLKGDIAEVKSLMLHPWMRWRRAIRNSSVALAGMPWPQV